MKAGKLDRLILLQRSTSTNDDLGSVVQSWAPVATLRAQLIQSSTTEFLQGAGTQGEAVAVFRTRWLDGVMVRDRVLHEGIAHDIKEVKELGRRAGLELRCVARNAQ